MNGGSHVTEGGIESMVFMILVIPVQVPRFML